MSPRPLKHRRPASAASSRLTAVDPTALLRSPEQAPDPVLRAVLERARSASRPGARADDRLVCLAIEGGGMRGAVPAGMCVVLQAAGLVDAFDRIYGVSAGALTGSATAAGQAGLSATYFEDAAAGGVINRMRPLLRRPVVDFDLLFEELISARKPLSFEGFAAGPEFRALATSLDTLSLRVLRDFADVEELMRAVRASASLPRLGGEPPLFRGERMTDGGLLEPLPFATALAEGATHVLVLRSRPADYRRAALRGLGEALAVRDQAELGALMRERRGLYNRQAAALARGCAPDGAGAWVAQVTVPDRTPSIARLETDGELVRAAIRVGAEAMAAAILTEPISLCWQPVVHRCTPAQ